MLTKRKLEVTMILSGKDKDKTKSDKLEQRGKQILTNGTTHNNNATVFQASNNKEKINKA